MLRRFLIRLLGGDLPSPDQGAQDPTIEALSSLTGRVLLLEEMQTRRELEWADVAERLRRYLSRITAVEGKMRQHQGDDEDPKTAIRRQLLAAKFPQLGE